MFKAVCYFFGKTLEVCYYVGQGKVLSKDTSYFLSSPVLSQLGNVSER